MGNCCSASNELDLLEEISEVSSDPMDLRFPTDDISAAIESDREHFENGYRQYVDMGNDTEKGTINHKMKVDMDAAEFKDFLVEVKRDLSLGNFHIKCFQELEGCANEGWKFTENSKENMQIVGENRSNFFYYNIQRSADGHGTQFKFSLAVCYLKSGRAIENNFVFYGGLIKENLLRKKRASEEDNFKFKLYLKFST